ncbi:tetratricopeptide repeat protein [Candidatus Competibacter phosphatis]|uniref:Tetratricopeptide repeat protein n=1 Tax=Candidatus Competibacter phosphatis TaxID=221280 RepID=A0ABX1TI58_9GAMM|nr:tetratricopeptide repeat protein [Candidatus Competibacter phosphatis]NMQ19062.1 tetratricopeptide repeat protein [Candidatus Competibacter phosphatis]
MTAWFVERLPESEAGQEDDQGRRWDEIHQENAALVEWLARVLETDWVQIERAGSRFAIRNGPFGAWLAFCERALRNNLADDEKSNILWTAGNVAQSAGLMDRALALASQKTKLDQSRGAAREAALAWGLMADVYQARGQWDEALRIRQEEQLPVYERLGDVRSRAVTLGQIADVLQARGQLDEALRIRQEEQLPVYERLQSVRDLLICRANIGIYYLMRGEAGDREKALELLRLALQDAQRLQLPEAQQIAGIIRQVEHPPESG